MTVAAPPPPATDKVRRAELRQRRRQSVPWTAVYLLGSLNLAMILLLTIAGAVAFATIMESKFDTAVARYYIYHASWFYFWLLLLALNLAAAALTRWPWERKHLGFVVTHAGIILLLAGAVIGHVWGFEAFVTLDKTKPPESRLYLKDDILMIDAPNGLRGQMPLDTEMHPPSEQRPVVVPIEDTALRVVVDRLSDKLESDDHLLASADANAPPGIALHFLNTGMKQNVAVDLLGDDEGRTFDFFTLARIDLVASLDEAHPVALPPAATPPPPGPRDETPFHETQMIFAHAGVPPIVISDSDVNSGYAASLFLEPNPGRNITVTVTAPNGTTKSWPLKIPEQKWMSLGGDGDPIYFRVAKFWSHFAMKNGQPTSLAEDFGNPAILLQVTGPSRLLPAAAPVAAPPLPKSLILRLAPAKEPGRIVYELQREGKVEGRGISAIGDTIRLGWSRWVAHVDAVFPHAELHRDLREHQGELAPQFATGLRLGIRAHLAGPGADGEPVWIPAGSDRELFHDHDVVRLGFGQKVVPLDFLITLENFQVPRDEGTDSPADYISSLRFDDLRTGAVVRGTAHMNSPAEFPGGFWRSFLGWNYKFSQANWDPQNLNQTTLQVLYDPGWPFKWSGSLGICCGIALMFYFMPRRTARERSGREENQP